MTARLRSRLPAVLGALLALTVLVLFDRPVDAQMSGTTGWRVLNIMNDTIALGAMDTSKIVDLTNHRYVAFRVKIIPPAGVVAEPWSEVVIRAIGCDLGSCDSNNTGTIQLQPIADRSYIASATGDSLTFGRMFTANKLQVGNGEIHYRYTRSNSTFAYPNADWFELGNKGTQPRVRYVYLQVRHTATSSSGATSYCKAVITALVSN